MKYLTIYNTRTDYTTAEKEECNVSLILGENNSIIFPGASNNVEITGISIIGDTNFYENENVNNFKAVFTPNNTTETNVTWSLSGNGTLVSDGDMCTVIITGDSPSTSTLTVTSTSNSSITSSIQLTYEPNPLKSLTISGATSGDTADGRRDFSQTYTVIYNPSNTTQTGVTWTYSGDAYFSPSGNTCYVSTRYSTYITLTATSTVNPNIKATIKISVS